LDQPQLIEGDQFYDDRGSIAFCNDAKLGPVKRFYQVSNSSLHYVRAWHGHKKEGKYLYAVKGVFRIGAVHLESERVSKYYLAGYKPQVLYIPPGYANGLQNLSEQNVLMIFSTSTVQESMDDDIRFPWDKWDIWRVNNYR